MKSSGISPVHWTLPRRIARLAKIFLLPLHRRPYVNPRLVIDAACTSCGQFCDLSLDPMAIPQLALDHAAATGHVVVLNGTADVPEIDEEPTTHD
jgi:hypothetical protein